MTILPATGSTPATSDHQAVRGQVAPVPEHDAADVPHPFAVHEDPAGVHPFLKGGAPGVEADLVAVGGQEDAVLGDPHGPGQAGVLDEVAHLPVDGDEDSGAG